MRLKAQKQSDLRMRAHAIFSGKGVFESEQHLFFPGRSLNRGEIEMRHWIQDRRGLSAVQLQIALLTLGVIAAGAWLTYYTSSLPR
jgi:hypothetical protein